jgi:hypothetical protein
LAAGAGPPSLFDSASIFGLWYHVVTSSFERLGVGSGLLRGGAAPFSCGQVSLNDAKRLSALFRFFNSDPVNGFVGFKNVI